MRILLTTFGSFGDIHPYLAIGLELKARGHQPIIATSEIYREKIAGAGIDFRAVRPDLPSPETAGPIVAKVMNGAAGPRYLFEEILMPGLRGSYEDLSAAVAGCDIMVSHVISMAAPLVAAKTGVPWISSVLAPISFYSCHELCVPPVAEPLFALRHLGPQFLKICRTIGVKVLDGWVKPYYELQKELGLPRGANPIVDEYSPRRVLALFSRHLGGPQPDWPPQTVQSGFCLYDQKEHGAGLSPELESFLSAGDPPIVFTLGTSAVFDARNFFSDSARAAQLLGRRAILLTGTAENAPSNLPPGVAAFDYAPYSGLFPRACAIVHQGGVGTTAQAMRAGRPILVMPFAHDQPDHAYRMNRLGIGRRIARNNYSVTTAARELRLLLNDEGYSHRAKQIGAAVSAENGVARACDEIEALAGPGS